MAKSIKTKEVTKQDVADTPIPDDNAAPKEITINSSVDSLVSLTKDEQEYLGSLKITPVVKNENTFTGYTIELTNEQKILQYVEKSSGNPVRLNEFLKSLYMPVNIMEPGLWKQQGVSKQIKGMLQGMVDRGDLVIKDNVHHFLGKFYHHGEQQVTKHQDLDSIIIFAQK